MSPQALFVVVETLPDGRERVLSEPLPIADAMRAYHDGRVKWAGVIRPA